MIYSVENKDDLDKTMTFPAYKSYVLLNQAGATDPVKLETLNEQTITVLGNAIQSVVASVATSVALIAALAF